MQLQQNFPRQTLVSTIAELFLLLWIDYDQIMMGWDWIVEVRRGVCRGLWEMRRREDIPVLFLSPPPVAAGHWTTEHTISQHNLHSTALHFSSPIFSPPSLRGASDIYWKCQFHHSLRFEVRMRILSLLKSFFILHLGNTKTHHST